MSDLFSHLLQRHHGTVPVVEPRRPSRFETTGVAPAAAESLPRSEDPRPAAGGEPFTVPPAAPPAPAGPPSRQASWRHRPAMPPARDKEREDPTAAGQRRPSEADGAPRSRPKHTAAASPEKTRPLEPQEPLSQASDPGDHHRRQADTGAVPKPALAPGEIRPRFSTRITGSMQQPIEMPAQRTAAAQDARDAPRPSDPPARPAVIATQPVVEPPAIHPPVYRENPVQASGRPVAAVPPTKEHPPVQAPGNPAPDAPAGDRPAIVDPAPLMPLDEENPGTREHLLVPPDWLARMQRDFLRDLEAGASNAKPEPAINVTIGRVEVRAEAPPAPPKPEAGKKASPVMSLDEYLNQRRGRG
jgi:hypothetical protein